MAEIQMYNHDCFVFIDETGCSSKDHTQKFGYALRGKLLLNIGGFIAIIEFQP